MQDALKRETEALDQALEDRRIGIAAWYDDKRRLGAVASGVYNYGSRWDYNPEHIHDITENTQCIPFENVAYDGLGNRYSTCLRADSDGVSPRYLRPWNGVNPHRLACGWLMNSGHDGLSVLMHNMPPSSITGRTILLPMLLSVEISASGYCSPLGYVPDMRWVRMDNFAPGDALVIAGDTWRIFPIIKKNGGLGDVDSQNFAMAYLQRP